VAREFPNTLKVSDVNSKHAYYNADLLTDYWRFYIGGRELLDVVENYLVKREFEPTKVYNRRVMSAYYINYVGSALAWYGQTMFRIDPVVSLDPKADSTKSTSQEKWFSQFAMNANGNGESLYSIARLMTTETLVFGRGYLLLDLPPADSTPLTLAEEKQLGLDNIRATYYSALNAINWGMRDGALDWIVFQTESVDSLPLSSEKIYTWEWHFWDTESYAIYRISKSSASVADAEVPKLEDDDTAVLVTTGTHMLAQYGVVPVACLDFTEDNMWLMNRAYGAVKETFNSENALSRAVEAGLFALPVIKSQEDFAGLVGEAYFIQLKPNDSFEFAEPGGTTYQLAADRMERMKDEIYRLLGLIGQANPSENADVRQSGYSKERDYQTTKELMMGLGVRVRTFLQRVIRMAQLAKGYDPTSVVTGMEDFDVRDTTTILQEAQTTTIVVPSKKLAKHVLARVVKKTADDATHQQQEEMIKELSANIDSGKTGPYGTMPPPIEPPKSGSSTSKSPAQSGNTSKNQPVSTTKKA
jgi:hypothetical protein